MLARELPQASSGEAPLHDLILRKATGCLFAFHWVATVCVLVLDKREPERASSVLVAREFSC